MRELFPFIKSQGRRLTLTLLVLMHCPIETQAVEDSSVLVYVFSPTCASCKRFDKEVGQIYSKTTEGKKLPMLTVSLNEWRNSKHNYSDCNLNPISATPSFIQISGCLELDRLVGYSSEELFWLSLNRMTNGLANTTYIHE